MHAPSPDDRLARLEAKLDLLLARAESTDELVDDAMHAARELTAAWRPVLADRERRGWFAKAGELLGAAERVLDGYTVEDVRLLADNAVAILDTVRNLTQPDVLALANEAGDAMHHADEVEPVGPFGMLRATQDADVQRGLAVMLDVLRRVGQATAKVEARGAPAPRGGVGVPAGARSGPRAATAPVVHAPVAAASTATVPASAPAGVAFDAQGFLVDPSAWTPALAERLAAEAGVALTDAHWTVIRWVREERERSGVSPNVRRISVGAGLAVADLYRLFPKGPGKLAARLAGIPKPAGCV